MNRAWDLMKETCISVYQNIGTMKAEKYIKLLISLLAVAVIGGKTWGISSIASVNNSGNPAEAYNEYVNDVLVNEYGKFNSFHVEYGYGMGEYSIRAMPAVLDKGIISTHIEDMDLDGVPELIIFTASPASLEERGTNIDFHMYHIEGGDIKYLSGGRLCTSLFQFDEHEFRIFIKDFGDRKVLGASSGGYGYIGGDGAEFEIHLYQLTKNHSVQKLYTNQELASDWDDSKASWISGMHENRFDVTANEWSQRNHWTFLISMNEPDCNFLITGQCALNVSAGEFNASRWGEMNYQGEDFRNCPYKVIGDIVVNN